MNVETKILFCLFVCAVFQDIKCHRHALILYALCKAQSTTIPQSTHRREHTEYGRKHMQRYSCSAKAFQCFYSKRELNCWRLEAFCCFGFMRQDDLIY